jgi:hypothetical protein
MHAGSINTAFILGWMITLTVVGDMSSGTKVITSSQNIIVYERAIGCS